MQTRLYNFWILLKESLWFIPLVICFGFALATISLHIFESNVNLDYKLPSVLVNLNQEKMAGVIMTLLNSMITLATFAISITMVVLSLSASQLGPRLIRNFIGRRKTQLFVGYFFGTVTACFIFNHLVHQNEYFQSKMGLTINFILLLCFINLFILLAYVHHIAASCIADNVIVSVSNDLNSIIHRLCDSDGNNQNDSRTSNPRAIREITSQKTEAKLLVKSKQSGYIQNINFESLTNIAGKKKLILLVLFKAGDFMINDQELIEVYGLHKEDREELIDDLLHCFTMGSKQTSTQDIEYSIRHLSEIGLRALSPGINDDYTALTVIDHLCESMTKIFKLGLPESKYYDDQGEIRVITDLYDERDLIKSAFAKIREAGQSKSDIIQAYLRKLTYLSQFVTNTRQNLALLDEFKHLEMYIDKNFKNDYIYEELANLAKKTREELNPSLKFV
jgi:uncharacterized membrane protein